MLAEIIERAARLKTERDEGQPRKPKPKKIGLGKPRTVTTINGDHAENAGKEEDSRVEKERPEEPLRTMRFGGDRGEGSSREL